MSERTTRRVALAVVVFMAALTLANIVLPALGHEALNNPDADLFFGIISTIGSMLYVGIGLLIAVRARNVIGWYLVVVGLSYGLLAFGTAYGAAGIVTFPGSLPAAVEVSTLLAICGSSPWSASRSSCCCSRTVAHRRRGGGRCCG